jgi:hypothetical protein
MIEPPSLFTHERLIFDIREIESLATLTMDLSLPIDHVLCESFERLVELAGTRDFVLAFSKLQDYMFQIKVRQTRAAEMGLIVPASSLQELNDYAIKMTGLISVKDSRRSSTGGGLAGADMQAFLKMEPIDLEKLGLKKHHAPLHPKRDAPTPSGSSTKSKKTSSDMSLPYQSPFHQSETGSAEASTFYHPDPFANSSKQRHIGPEIKKASRATVNGSNKGLRKNRQK